MNISVTEAAFDSLLKILHDVNSRRQPNYKNRSLPCLSDVEQIIEQCLAGMCREQIKFVQYKDD